jgi:hypothetical protein
VFGFKLWPWFVVTTYPYNVVNLKDIKLTFITFTKVEFISLVHSLGVLFILRLVLDSVKEIAR